MVLAVADEPTGPFTELFQVIQPWAHNPEAIVAADGTVVVFTLGDGVPIHGPEVAISLSLLPIIVCNWLGKLLLEYDICVYPILVCRYQGAV